jgi:hypothetical protein
MVSTMPNGHAVGRINDTRNAIAHGFFPENRRIYAGVKKVLHNKVELFSLAGVRAFKGDFHLVTDYLMKRIGF